MCSTLNDAEIKLTAGVRAVTSATETTCMLGSICETGNSGRVTHALPADMEPLINVMVLAFAAAHGEPQSMRVLSGAYRL